MVLKTPKNGFIPNKNKYRIFQIGFNKCGTRTLFKFFQNNGINSVHYDKGLIAGSMYRHSRRGEPIIDIRYRDVTLFADIENIYKENNPLYGQYLFKEMDHQCHNSKFILNTRNKDNWLRSRILHENGKYLSIISTKLNISKRDVVKLWSDEWDQHHLEVIDYFRDRPNDLLIFNIERDPIEKLINFFNKELKLNPRLYIHKGKSSDNFSVDKLDKVTKTLYREIKK